MASDRSATENAGQLLTQAYSRLREAVRLWNSSGSNGTDDEAGVPTLPPKSRIAAAMASLPRVGRARAIDASDAADDGDAAATAAAGWQPRGADATLAHIVDDIVPALTGQNLSGRYYGFVTGSTLPVAEAADNVVSALDQNAASHLPAQQVCTAVEDVAFQMLVELFGLDGGRGGSHTSTAATIAWPGRLLTTGATASNVLGLAQGREAVLRSAGQHLTGPSVSVSQLGLVEACRQAGVDNIRILTSMAHSSLYKAASIVGLGRDAVVDLPYSAAEPWRLDLAAVERELSTAAAVAGSGAATGRTAYIIAVSAGEVNTGRFATVGWADMHKLRSLADTYGAWLHVDGAFGLYARVLPDTAEFALLRKHAEGLELADSITSDAHKLLNVPYDAGIFFSRHKDLQADVFHNPNAAYLSTLPSSAHQQQQQQQTKGPVSSLADLPSPLNMGIENSRRFRALPVYAVLLSEGPAGVSDMVVRMVRLARGVRRFLRASTAYECLAGNSSSAGDTRDDDAATFIIVLFRARDPARNAGLVDRINATRQLYVSGTQWQGQPACRLAVSSWRVDVARDLAIVEDVLTRLAAE